MAAMTVSSIKELKKMMNKKGRSVTPKRSEQGWHTIGGAKKFYRSGWELKYAKYLEFLKSKAMIQDWKYEPREFWFLKIKRGVRSYKPDFRVKQRGGVVEYHEVKGWMDPKSKTKLKRMAKYYPEVVVKVIDSKWFKENSPLLSGLVEGWNEKCQHTNTPAPPVKKNTTGSKVLLRSRTKSVLNAKK